MKIIDMHTHVWSGHEEDNRRDLIEAVETVPLVRLYASGLHGQHPSTDEVAAINNAVHQLMRDCPRARGLAYLNPCHEQRALAELKRCIDLGFSGIKLWIATQAHDPLNFAIYEAAIENALPVLLHSFNKASGQKPHESTPWHVAEAARRYPECTFIMAHTAADFIAGTESVVGLANVVVDISGTYGEKGMVEYAAARLGADKVLFGSDMPGSDLYHNLGKVTGAQISTEQRDMILCGTAERIFP